MNGFNTFIGWIAEPLAFALTKLYGVVGNYGFTLLIFTIIVKFCLYPLYAKQVKSMANMAKVQPKIKALQQRYANDKETLNRKMMELYKEEKFNPAGGCLPMLIQMPIIFGLFALLRNPLAYISGEKMLLAIHESFLWIPDLSQPDPWILPLAAGITTFFSFTLTQKQSGADDENNPGAAMMKPMKYFFPVMIVWWGRSFPAGLTIYWFLSQVIQVFFTLHLNRVRRRIMDANELEKKNS